MSQSNEMVFLALSSLVMECNAIHHIRLTRRELNLLKGIPMYSVSAAPLVWMVMGITLLSS